MATVQVLKLFGKSVRDSQLGIMDANQEQEEDLGAGEEVPDRRYLPTV